MYRQPLSKSVRSTSRRDVLLSAVAPLFEGLETRSHFSATPTAVAGGPYSVDEGQSVLISGLASTDSDGTIAGYQWDTNYNAQKGFKTRATTGTWTFHADTSGSRTIALRVIDNNGDVGAIQTATINIADVAPTLTLTAPDSALEGTPVSINWSYSDVGSNDDVTGWTVDWGDGTSKSFAGDISQATHTYAEDGDYDIELTSTQAERTTSVTHSIEVINDGPIVQASTPKDTIDEGEMVQLDFLTTNRAGTLDSWTIDWGDGRSDVLEPTRSHAAHFFTDSGVYTATIMAQEPDGGFGQQTVVFTVNNVAPEISITNTPSTGNEGTAVTLGSTMTDAGQDDTHAYGWTVYRNNQLFTLPNGTNTSGTSFTFTPTDNGSYVVRLTVTDDEGAQATVNSTPIVIANVAPTGIISGTPGTISEGTPVNLSVAPSDAGSEDTFSYAWSVTKDSAVYSLPENAVTNTANFTFTPGDNGTYVATVVITDDDGDTVSVSTAAITVTNAAPTANISGAPSTANENDDINVSADVTDAGADDTHTYQWSVEKQTAGTTGGTVKGGYGRLQNYTFDDGTLVLRAKIDPMLNDHNGNILINANTGSPNYYSWTLEVMRDGSDYEFDFSSYNSAGGGQVSALVPTSEIGTDYFTVAIKIDKDNNNAAVINVNGVDRTTTGSIAGALPSPVNGPVYFSNRTDMLGFYAEQLSAADIADLHNGNDISTEARDLWNFDEAPGSGTATSDHGSVLLMQGNPQFSGPAVAYTPVTLPNNVVSTDKDFTFTPTDNGIYRLKLTVTDKDGAVVNTQSSDITVNNVAPQGTISGEDEATEGDALNFNVDVVDASEDTQTYSWSVKKDNVTYTLPNGTVTNTDSFGFTPDDNGSYEVSVLITDKDGASSTATHTVTVANAAPSATIDNAPTTGTEGSPITAGSTATDAGANESLTYAWSVTKDSEPYTLDNNVAVDGSSFAFTPADNGTYVLSLTVTDKDGDSKLVTSEPIVVANVDPTATVSGEPNGSIAEGDTVSLAVTPADAGVLDTFTYAWSIRKDGHAYEAGSDVSLTGDTLNFVAKDNGVYIATVVVTDKDGGQVSVDSRGINVINTAPTATIDNAPNTGDEGTAITVGSTVTDAGVLDTHSYQWSVEQGSLSSSAAVDLTGNTSIFVPVSNQPQQATFALSIKSNVAPAGDQMLFKMRTMMDDLTVSATANGFKLDFGGDSEDVTASYTATDYHQLAVSVDYATGVVKLFLDGQAIHQTQAGFATSNFGGLRRVDLWGTNSGGFDGRVADLQVFDAALSDADASAVATGQPASATPINRYDFTNGTVGGGNWAISYPNLQGGGNDVYVGTVDTVAGPDVSGGVTTLDLPSSVVTDGQTFTFTPPDNGTYRIKLLVTDKDGATVTATSSDITVANVNPAGSISGPTTANEGSAVSLSATATDAGSLDTLTYAWSVTKDSQPVTLPNGYLTNNTTFNYTPANQGSYVFTCLVTDKDGGTKSLTHTVTVANVAPSVALTDVPSTGLEGTAITVDSTATDPGDDSLTYGWTVYRNQQLYTLPNGTVIDGTGFTFTPTDNGSYVIRLSVNDGDGGITTKNSAAIAVAGVDPVATITGSTTGTEGQAVQLGSTATDASTDDQAAGFTYAWTAKRGSTTVATGTSASFDFTPSVHGTYAIKLIVTDKDGLSTTTTSQVSVANVAPSNTAISGSLTGINEGQAVSLTASASDASGDTLSYAWKVMNGETVFASGNTRNIAFTAARGSYSLVVTVTDTAGATDSKTSAFTVANVAPTGSMTAPTDNVLINTAATFTLTANDAQPNQNLNVAWNFGDNTGTQQTMTAGQSVSRTHTYATRGNYTVTATISDGVTQTVVTKTVTVSEAAIIVDPADTAKQALVVVGSEANDTIDVAQQSNGKYAVTFNGANLGSAFSPTSRIYVYGNGGVNNITVSGKTDAIVYAGTLGGNVSTGDGNDVIVGSAGVDRLNGGGGRDIIIGAAGSDILRGGDGEDLLVAGGLTKMNDTSSVVSMMNTWGDSSLTLAVRKNNLGAVFSKQLISDEGSNQLYGEAGNDWMVLNTSTDRLKDLQAGDVVN
ncbi:MAG: PKD domain-containing protein [Tepidisphaeraceae bacterium]